MYDICTHICTCEYTHIYSTQACNGAVSTKSSERQSLDPNFMPKK